MSLLNLALPFQAAVFGMILGSFLNVCIYRIPLKLSLMGRSFCPLCRTPIPFYRNVPVLAYILQRGKTACCRKPISIQYPAIELITGLLSVVTLLHVAREGQTLTHYFVWFLLFICPLIVVSIIDFQLRIIPDVISIPFILVGILVQIFEKLYQAYPIISYDQVLDALGFSILGILAGGGTLWLLAEIFGRIKKVDAMGGGDIKLAAMLGAFLGWRALIFIFFASSVIALVYAFSRYLITRDRSDATIPFGPFLSMGAILFYLYGKPITDWYFLGHGFPRNLIIP